MSQDIIDLRLKRSGAADAERESDVDLDALLKLLPDTVSARKQQLIRKRLLKWAQMAKGAYAANTVRGWRGDWNLFAEFAQRERLAFLPATPDTVRKFVLARAALGCKISTIRRNTASITRMHKAAGVVDPVTSEAVRLAKREVARQNGSRQSQARALTWTDLSQFLAIRPEYLRDYRDRAMACLAYDGLCRREEVVAFDLEHITWEPDGAATLLIEKSKTDQEGEGAVIWLAPASVLLLKEWLQRAGITTGPIFRQVIGHAQLADRLTAQSVADAMERLGKRIQLPADEQRLSGHSARVGAAQDLLSNNHGMPAIMQQGRWKDGRMVIRYSERLLASRGAMAQMARTQGRC